MAEPSTRISVVRPEWQAPRTVRVFNTTRRGGVSQAPFDSLNLGLHVNDDALSVHENRRLLTTAEALPEEPRWLRQVHGHHVVSFPQIDTAAEKPVTADAAFTDVTATVLTVMTADCLPVAICNDSGTRLAVAHAGWKGLSNGVLENCLAKFPDEDTLHIWLGPAIGPRHFEVGEEVYDAFVSTDASQQSCFAAHTSVKGKYFADLYALARRIIQRGRENSQQNTHISGGDYCTYADRELFHSYRRDGAKSGRMALLAWLESTNN